MQVTIEDEERILSLDEQFILIDCSSFEYLFGQQHESSIFVIRSFHSLSDQPFYTVHTILRASRHGRARERTSKKKNKREERERIIIVQSSRQRIRIHIHSYIQTHTRVYHFFKLLDPVHVRVHYSELKKESQCLLIVLHLIHYRLISVIVNIER